MLRQCILALLCLLLSIPAHAATWPEKPIQMVVPWNPGGSSDISARIVGDKMKKYLPQPMVVSNIAGALGLNGARQVYKARPDGYTLLWEHPGNLAVSSMVTKANFSWHDLDPLCTVVSSDMALIVPKDSKFKDAKSLFEYIKTHPGEVRWSLSPNGVSHFAWLAMCDSLGNLDAKLIPTSGDKDRIVSLLGGNSDATCVSYAAAKPYIDSGDIRLLAMVNSKRSDLAPEVPTLKEQGVNASYDYRCSVFAPKNTPADVKKALVGAFEKTLHDPETVEALKKSMFHPDFRDTATTTKNWTQEENLYRDLAAKYKLLK